MGTVLTRYTTTLLRMGIVRIPCYAIYLRDPQYLRKIHAYVVEPHHGHPRWVLVAPHLLCNATITWLFGAMDRLPNLDAHRQLCYFSYMNLWELIGKMYAWCTIAILAYIGVKAWYTAKHPIMNHIDIHVNKHLSRDYIVAFASDLHFGMVLGKSFGHRLVKDMNALHPDVLPCFALSKCSVMAFPKIVILLLYPLVA